MDDAYIVRSPHIEIAQREHEGKAYYAVHYYKAKHKFDHIEIVYDRDEAFNRAIKYVKEVTQCR